MPNVWAVYNERSAQSHMLQNLHLLFRLSLMWTKGDNSQDTIQNQHANKYKCQMFGMFIMKDMLKDMLNRIC